MWKKVRRAIEQFKRIDKQISQNIQESRSFTPRPNAANGLWCTFLVPLTFLLAEFRYECPLYFKLASCQCLGFFVQSVIFLIFATFSPGYIDQGSCILPALISSTLCYVALGQDLLFTLVVSFSLPIIFHYGFRELQKQMPNTFTLGESFVVTQSILIVLSSVLYLIYEGRHIKVWTDVLIIRYIDYVGLATIISFTILLSFDLIKWTTTLFLSSLGATTAALLVFLHVQLGTSPVLWLLRFLLFDKTNLILLFVWICAVIAAIIVSLYQTQNGKASTSARKVFHLLASFVFTTGILYRPELLRLATCVAVAGALILECIRRKKVTPFAEDLQNIFDTYADERDIQGGYAFTPISLFLGLGFPLLLPIYKPDVVLLSGVLSVGIGDSFASWYGANYGKSKIGGTNKTMEGFAANIISQIGFVFGLCLLGFMEPSWSIMFRVSLSAFASAFVEVNTDQIDNLVLPFVTATILLMTKSLGNLEHNLKSSAGLTEMVKSKMLEIIS